MKGRPYWRRQWISRPAN